MHNVILGGGIAGLTSAILLARKGVSDVLLIEANQELGGLLRSFDYGPNGKFDYGTHCIVDAYGDEINEIFGLMVQNGDWQVHTGVRSDLSGVYHHKQFNDKTVFVDMKVFPEEKYNRYLASYLGHIENKSDEAHSKSCFSNARAYLVNAFGSLITDEVCDPILFKIFDQHAVDLHPLSAKVIPLNRLVFFGETVSKELLATSKINSAVAYPDQLTLPEKFWPSYRAFYPSCRGIDALILGLEKMALSLGCKIIKGKKVRSIDIKGGAIDSLLIENERIQVKHLVSSIPVFQLGKLLGLFEGPPNMDPPKHTVITNFVFDHEAVRDLNSRHYVYCYDTERTIFRITNYNALTNKNDGKVPLTVESIYTEFEEKDVCFDVLRQLTEMGLVSKPPLFAKAEALSYGFPLLTTRNMDFIQDIRQKIHTLSLHNFTRVGLLNEAEVFFMRDVLIDVEQKILNMCSK